MSNSNIEQQFDQPQYIPYYSDLYTSKLQSPIGMKLVNENEYNNLLRENTELKSQILQLSSSEEILKKIIISRDKKAENFKKNLKKLLIKLESLKLNFIH